MRTRFRITRLLAALLLLPCGGSLPAADADGEVVIASTMDGDRQPALLDIPAGAQAASKGPSVPLLVFLHSWSARYNQSNALQDARAESRRRGWVFLSPNFRGPNNRPEACGSDLAMHDILDAVVFARMHARVDPRRIYLLGGSGGGHMSLMMAARAPKLWAAVSAWVPISDLAAWHAFSKRSGSRYAAMLESCCGGPPASPAAMREYRARSPLYHLARARGLRIAIDAGIHDGHKGSVPVSHSLLAFNELAKANGFADCVLSAGEIDEFTAAGRVPEALQKAVEAEPGRKHKVLFRRSAGPVRLTIFEGGHEMDVNAGVNWLASTPAPR
ncbi:MAG: prolyl oligopeptidase family serine peptidase [Bryobacteraceae bacterium]|nr:prolyl oligopeptidase family serine peptidase [Bryobacterales bacterium]NUM99907.1 prolyl oligopeptidase family serine peptidase [Bryobacteraceae bacterium]